jgi:hypothetical protein
MNVPQGETENQKMSAGSLEPANGIIERKDGFIYVAGIIQREGVYNSGLKLYAAFEDSIPLLKNLPVLRGEHPTDPVTGEFVPHSDSSDIIGTIAEAVKDPKNKLARGIYKLEEAKLTPIEISNLERGLPLGTSPGYWCNKESLTEPRIWEDGKPYTFIEDGSFKYDHIATPKKPACRDCGILINSEIGDDGIAKVRTPGEILEAAAKLQTEGEPAFLVNQALDEITLQNEILDILECPDEYAKGQKACKLLVQVLKVILAVPVETLSVMSQKNKSLEDNMEEKKPVIDEAGIMDKLRLMVNAELEPVKADLVKSQATIAEQATALATAKAELEAVKTAEAGRQADGVAAKTAADAAAEEGRKKTFMEKLKPGIAKTEEEAKALWETVKADIGGWILSNPDKMVFSANSAIPHVMGKGEQYVPKGATIAPGISVNADNKDDYFRSLGIMPSSELIAQHPEWK